MKQFKSAKAIVVSIWIAYLLIFFLDFNFFPILKFDLYSRASEFTLKESLFLARPKGTAEFGEDISKQFAFSVPWKFLVTMRILLREHPDKLDHILKDRLHEINALTDIKYSGVRYIVILDNVKTQVTQAEIE